MNSRITYDTAIIGGGLAGLALSIQLAKKGHTVILLEKETYPLHRVCGEYISLESWDFLHSLGLGLSTLHVPLVTKLHLSGENGHSLQITLPLGGFGISRYLLDHTLANLARKEGVIVKENSRVNNVIFSGEDFAVETARDTFRSRVVCGSFGKRSNLDIRWKRPFVSAAKNKLNNYVGIKYHMRLPYPGDTIALHNFRGGYCGIVQVENDIHNVCYLTRAANLQACSGNIELMEEKILSINPHLKQLFSIGQKCEKDPVTISQISFDKKSQVEDHILMVGDAAGMITPLCGNGMSMALHASKLAAGQVHLFLDGSISRMEMEERYTHLWRKMFGHRLSMGRYIQRLMNQPGLTNLVISAGRKFPGIVRWMARQTHGSTF